MQTKHEIEVLHQMQRFKALAEERDRELAEDIIEYDTYILDRVLR
jgi:hypothetical protein